MRLKGIALLIACVLFLSLSICQAEERKDEWKNPAVNFRAIKTILVYTSADPKAELDEFNVRKLETFYANVFFQDKTRWAHSSFNFISLNQFKDMITKATGENIRQLEVEDQARYKAEIDRFTPIIADAVLHIKVTTFGYDKRYVPESFYTYTEQVEKEIDTSYRDSRGNWIHTKKIIKVPVERTVITPAHYDTYANAGMNYMLVDAKTKESVWMLLDVREANGKHPIDMTERIIIRTAECLLKL